MSSKPILYHQNGCGMCKAAQMMLEKKGIEYDSVTINPDNVDEFIAKGIMGTPAIEVDGRILLKKDAMDWIKGN